MKIAIELLDKLLKVTPKQLVELRYAIEDLNPQIKAIRIKNRDNKNVASVDKEVYEKIMANLPKWTIELYQGFVAVETEIRTRLRSKNVAKILAENKRSKDPELDKLISQNLPEEEFINQLRKLKDYNYTVNNVSSEDVRNLWKEIINEFLKESTGISFEACLIKAYQNLSNIRIYLNKLQNIGVLLEESFNKNFNAEHYFLEFYRQRLKLDEQSDSLNRQLTELNRKFQEDKLAGHEKALSIANRTLSELEKQPESARYKDALASKKLSSDTLKELRREFRESPEVVQLNKAIIALEEGITGPRDALETTIRTSERPSTLGDKIISLIPKSLSPSEKKAHQSVSPPTSPKSARHESDIPEGKREKTPKKNGKDMLGKVASFNSFFNPKTKSSRLYIVEKGSSQPTTISPQESNNGIPGLPLVNSVSLPLVSTPPGSARSDSTGSSPSSARSNASPLPSPLPSPLASPSIPRSLGSHSVASAAKPERRTTVVISQQRESTDSKINEASDIRQFGLN